MHGDMLVTCPAAAQSSLRIFSTLRRSAIVQRRSHMTSKPGAVRNYASGDDPVNAYILRFDVQGAPSGPLAGLTLAVKDLFDVAGHPTGFGSPAWLESHPEAAAAHAPAVAALLAAGATINGKTHMDELAFSLNGENAHYGTPINTAAPGRIPGGSSSGSAAAVAAGLADIGLGSDTGGSVRIPASYCGIWGFRPTHGRISLAGARPLAPSYDTAGWFARDAELLQRVGQVLLSSAASAPQQQSQSQLPPEKQQQEISSSSKQAHIGGGLRLRRPLRWLVARDGFELAHPDAAVAMYSAVARSGAGRSVLGTPNEIDVAAGVAELQEAGLSRLQDWMGVFRVTQGHEIWAHHGAWVTSSAPTFGPGIKERFEMVSRISAEQADIARHARERLSAHVRGLLGDDGVLMLPTAPGPAVLCNLPTAELEDWRTRLISLTCIAGIAGLPQLSMPLAAVDGLPVGLSLIGPAGSDEELLALAVQLDQAVAAAAAEEAAAAGSDVSSAAQ